MQKATWAFFSNLQTRDPYVVNFYQKFHLKTLQNTLNDNFIGTKLVRYRVVTNLGVIRDRNVYKIGSLSLKYGKIAMGFVLKVKPVFLNAKSVQPYILVLCYQGFELAITYYIHTKYQELENQFCVIRVFVLTSFELTRFHCIIARDQAKQGDMNGFYFYMSKQISLSQIKFST